MTVARLASPNVRFRPIADISRPWDAIRMIGYNRIGALDIARAISERIGSYVDMNSIEFLAVEGDRILCWYMNAGGEGPTFEIELMRSGDKWALNLAERPAGTEQKIQLP